MERRRWRMLVMASAIALAIFIFTHTSRTSTLAYNTASPQSYSSVAVQNDKQIANTEPANATLGVNKGLASDHYSLRH